MPRPIRHSNVDGHDTAQKTFDLASLAFGTKVAQSAVYVEGSPPVAPEDLRAGAGAWLSRKNCSAWRGGPRRASSSAVHPTMVPRSSSIAQVMGVTNAGDHRRRGHSADHAGGPRRRRGCDRIRRGRGYRGRRTRHPCKTVRAAGGKTARHQKSADGAS